MRRPLPDPSEFQQGDTRATDQFRRLVRAHVRNYFQRESQIHDVTQDALLELLAKLDAGAAPTQTEYWTRNAAHNAVRRELTRLRHLAVQYESQLHGQVDTDHAALLDAREDLRRINELLGDCKELPQQALARSLEGRNHKEIAEDLGLSPGAARMTLSRARAELSDRLNAQQKISHLMQLARNAGLVDPGT